MIATMEEARALWTDEDVYLFVRGHLLGQRRRADDSTHCLYRTGSLACAVGCLIPDDLYDQDLEGKLVGELVHHGGARRLATALPNIFVTRNLWLLEALQAVHDGLGPEEWEDLLPPTLEAFEATAFLRRAAIERAELRAGARPGQWP